MSELREALAQFDGTHTAELVAALDVARDDLDGLVEVCGDRDLAVAATWVVKALLEQGEAVDLVPVYEGLGQQTEWAAQLHILQCVQYAPDNAICCVDDVQRLLDSKKALVRVWALDAFVRVADVSTDLRAQATAMVAAALYAKSASLRARARALNVICSGW